jgi:FMN phosphatase YigB (HAD superfamily)
MRYKALLLDFYGTLVEEDDLIVAEIAEAIATHSPVSSDAKLIRRDWKRYFQDLCVSRACYGLC